MDIPITDKLWQKSQFNSDFMEISYIDNHGTSFELIDPIKGTLKFYKNHNVDISQELLDNIKHIKSDDPKEQLFVKLFSNLLLITDIDWPNCLFLKQKRNNRVIGRYDMKNKYFMVARNKIWLKINEEKPNILRKRQIFLKNLLIREFKLYNIKHVTPF